MDAGRYVTSRTSLRAKFSQEHQSYQSRNMTLWREKKRWGLKKSIDYQKYKNERKNRNEKQYGYWNSMKCLLSWGHKEKM